QSDAGPPREADGGRPQGGAGQRRAHPCQLGALDLGLDRLVGVPVLSAPVGRVVRHRYRMITATNPATATRPVASRGTAHGWGRGSLRRMACWIWRHRRKLEVASTRLRPTAVRAMAVMVASLANDPAISWRAMPPASRARAVRIQARNMRSLASVHR